MFGTKTGRNLVKIVSERGMDGLVELLEEYNFEGLDEMEPSDAEAMDGEDEVHNHSDETVNHQTSEKKSSFAKASEGQAEPAPKKHFFKRIRK